MLNILISIVAIAIIVKSLFNHFFLYQVFGWLGNNKEENAKKVQPISECSVFFILPVYLEQANITKVLAYYSNILKFYKNTYLVVVAAQKEDYLENEQFKNKTTYYIAQQYISDNKYNNILLIKYPKDGGYMAHQVNYAFRYCNSHFLGENRWLFLLNIDSYYSEKGIKNIIETCQTGEKKIYQYSTLFTRNYADFSVHKNLLKAGALYQTRWMFVHELKRYIYNIKAGFCKKYQFAHAVGHGLLIPFSIFKELLFDEDYIVEDSLFGLFLRSCGYSIYPKSIFEIGDSPTSLHDYFRQQYTWSFGPLGHFIYWKKFKNTKYNIYKENRLRIFILCIQGCISSVNWQLSSWIFLFLLSSILFSNKYNIVLILCALSLYTLDFLFVLLWLRKKQYIVINNKALLNFFPSIWFIILTHSLPANIALIHLVLEKAGARAIRKNKTPHKI